MAEAEATHSLDTAGFGRLLRDLSAAGYRLVGPRLDGGVITWDVIDGIDDLPAGWTDRQEPGRYRLVRRDDGALFGYAVGAGGCKRFFYPPQETLLRIAPGDDVTGSAGAPDDEPPLALIGARPCDLAALAVHDRVLTGGAHVDAAYAERRARAFVVAVDCAAPAATCFCASLDTGPAAADGAGFDLALTEVIDGDGHWFGARAGSDAGAARLAALAAPAATAAQRRAAAGVLAAARAGMTRQLPRAGLEERILSRRDSPRWEEVARRCQSCGNCTLVCPTCFCHTVVDATDLAGGAARTRRWDTCFNLDFSYIHGGSVRASVASRYRQWLTHKLGTWTDQFGVLGCVGCGRCLTWCPVGIDLTEEAAALCAEAAAGMEGTP